MKKLLIILCSFGTSLATVSCGSGNVIIDLQMSPNTCNIGQDQLINLVYSGLKVGDPVDFRFTTPGGSSWYYYKECIVGQGECPFTGDSGYMYLSCKEIASKVGSTAGKYIFTLRQGDGAASDTLVMKE